MTDQVSITFDEDNKIRVLEADQFRDTEQLKNESLEFVKKVISLDEIIAQLTDTLQGFAKKIERERLRAVGQRNKVDSEGENRQKQMLDLNNQLNEKKSELERYSIEYESLLKVQAEQKRLIEKLSNNEA